MCQCPVVGGVKFIGDGYTHCQGNIFYPVRHGKINFLSSWISIKKSQLFKLAVIGSIQLFWGWWVSILLHMS